MAGWGLSLGVWGSRRGPYRSTLDRKRPRSWIITACPSPHKIRDFEEKGGEAGVGGGQRGSGRGPLGSVRGGGRASRAHPRRPPSRAAHLGAASSSRAPAGCSRPSAPDSTPTGRAPCPRVPASPLGVPAHLAVARVRGARGPAPAQRAHSAAPPMGPAGARAAGAGAGGARGPRRRRRRRRRRRGERSLGPGRAHCGRAHALAARIPPRARRARPVRLRRGSGSGVRAGGAEPAWPPRLAASDRPGAEGGAAGGDEVMQSEKGPDVTCSQSARAARGQVTSA